MKNPLYNRELHESHQLYCIITAVGIPDLLQTFVLSATTALKSIIPLDAKAMMLTEIM